MYGWLTNRYSVQRMKKLTGNHSEHARGPGIHEKGTAAQICEQNKLAHFP